MSDRLVRETNPPEGRIASPTPQYWDPASETWEKAEGNNGAIFALDPFDIRGLSTDIKPTDKAKGTIYTEVDTGDLYIWDGTLWNQIADDIWSDL